MIKRFALKLKNKIISAWKEPESGYYSQNGQDKYLAEKVFLGKRNGIFVDIGANDGVTMSNTYYMEKELGWTGMCIEPHPTVFQKLKAARKSVLINCALSEEETEGTFLKISGYAEMLSGLVEFYDENHLQRISTELKKYGGSKDEIKVKCRNINNLLKENGLTTIDYVSVDTEGAEAAIIATIDFCEIDIKVISIENHYKQGIIEKLMREKGYKLLVILGDDDVYIKK